MAVYLVIALMGTSTFSAAEALQFDELDNGPVSDGFLTTMDHTIDWLAESSTTIGRAKGYSSSPLRSGVLRIVMPLMVQSAGVSIVLSALNIIKKSLHPNIKNAIPLKLRI